MTRQRSPSPESEAVCTSLLVPASLRVLKGCPRSPWWLSGPDGASRGVRMAAPALPGAQGEVDTRHLLIRKWHNLRSWMSLSKGLSRVPQVSVLRVAQDSPFIPENAAPLPPCVLTGPSSPKVWGGDAEGLGGHSERHSLSRPRGAGAQPSGLPRKARVVAGGPGEKDYGQLRHSFLASALEQSGTDTEGWPCRMVIWRAEEGDAGAVWGEGVQRQAGCLQTTAPAVSSPSGTRGWAGQGIGRGCPEPQPHPQSFTRPRLHRLQMGDLRALPAPRERPCPAWTYGKEDI